MIHFTNMTPGEFFRMNEGHIPPEIEKFFDLQAQRIAELEAEVRVLNRDVELTEERANNASQLIEELIQWAEGQKLTKKALAGMNLIVENSYHER